MVKLTVYTPVNNSLLSENKPNPKLYDRPVANPQPTPTKQQVYSQTEVHPNILNLFLGLICTLRVNQSLQVLRCTMRPIGLADVHRQCLLKLLADRFVLV